MTTTNVNILGVDAAVTSDRHEMSVTLPATGLDLLQAAVEGREA